MGVDEVWRDLWCAGAVDEAEFRRMRASHDLDAARKLLDPAAASARRERLRVEWQNGIEAIVREDAPPRLRRAMTGSYLMIAGNAASLALPSVAIVGTRGVPAREVGRLRKLVEEIVRASVSVVSGGAYGVDTLCHDAALRNGVPAVVVIAGGLCHPSPAGSRPALRRVVADGGAVVTDRSPDRRPHRSDFVRRNALIAALSEVVVVVAAPEGSGALETARVARKLGVPVLAVPGAHDDPLFAGCHTLLRSGAGICTGPSDVLDALGVAPSLPLPVPRKLPSLSPDAACLLERLTAGETVDEVIRGGILTVEEAHRALLALQLEGLAPA